MRSRPAKRRRDGWAVFFVQPVDSNRSVIRGRTRRARAAPNGSPFWRHHNERLSKLREIVEPEAAAAPSRRRSSR